MKNHSQTDRRNFIKTTAMVTSSIGLAFIPGYSKGETVLSDDRPNVFGPERASRRRSELYYP